METIEQGFENLELEKSNLYAFASEFPCFSLYDSNSTITALNAGPYELLVGVGLLKQFKGNQQDILEAAERSKFWVFMCLPYGPIEEPDCEGFVYQPRLVIQIRKQEKKLRIINNGIGQEEFQKHVRRIRDVNELHAGRAPVAVQFKAGTDRREYLKCVDKIRNDIYQGKYYEMNYCIEFSASLQDSPVLPYFLKLNAASKAPFAAFVRFQETSLLCSSPERFLLREGRYLLSQPIKGTNKSLPGIANKKQLLNLVQSEKERAENVMIVDLVRNDLARVCQTGSIRVEELYGAYAYTSVNHLVSSISGITAPDIRLVDIFKALYPMGSMTGAPKVEVMKHIKLYEAGQRGLYSGSVGYLSPEKDFDFNVLIRTLEYRHNTRTISYKVGSAITYDSSAEEEYEECLLKGSRMASVFDI